MKKLTIGLLLVLNIMFISCSKNSDNDDGTIDPVYKQRMREFVISISEYAKNLDPDFIVIPQNGQELATADGEEEGDPATEYLAAIDGAGREDLFYGYNDDDEATPSSATEYMISFLDVFEANNVEVLVTDYCSTTSKMDDSYTRNAAKDYISFAASDRELNIIPDYPTVPYAENIDNISSLADAKNFLYIINPDQYETSAAFVAAVDSMDYDVILMDLFFDNDTGTEFTPTDLAALKTKSNDNNRLVIAYMSIGEAEDYRYYWGSSWGVGSPSWIVAENPDWEGNYIVQYWQSEWQDIIYGNNTSYLKRIIDAGFDGVYLDIIDAFEYFE